MLDYLYNYFLRHMGLYLMTKLHNKPEPVLAVVELAAVALAAVVLVAVALAVPALVVVALVVAVLVVAVLHNPYKVS